MTKSSQFFGFIILFSLVFTACNNLSKAKGQALDKVLLFTKVNEFDHHTRKETFMMFQDLGKLDGFEVEWDDDGSIFDHLDSLGFFEMVIFANTTGDHLLSPKQEKNLENYIKSGGSFMGIHSATDTYRNRSWPFYNELIGAIVQIDPYHTSADLIDTIYHVKKHRVLSEIPDPWIKQDEFYYWDKNGAWMSPKIQAILRVNRTGPESYDHDRPVAWFKETGFGGRSFYTALGHDVSNYTEPDNTFRKLIRNAIEWVRGANSEV